MKATGSLQIRNGKYHMFMRIQQSDGAMKQKSKTTGIPVSAKTKKEERANRVAAEIMLSEYLQDLSKCSVYKGDVLFTDAISGWLERKKNEIRFDTFESYICNFNAHIRPYFEPLRLQCGDVTTLDIKRYVAAKQNAGLSAKSIRKHLVILNGLFKEAVGLGELTFNPCSNVTVKSGCDEEFEGAAYTLEQAKELIEVVRGDPIEPVVYLGLYLGLRRSEIIGLRWKDVDFENNIVQVRNTVVQFREVSEAEKTKSKSSRRNMFIPDGLRAYLQQRYDAMKEIKASFGVQLSDDDHVCEWPDGTPYKPAYVTNRFRHVLARNGLPRIRLHDLRHTAGSLLLGEGADIKQVQIFLGHKRASTTLDIYAHVLTDGKKDTAQKLNSLFAVKKFR